MYIQNTSSIDLDNQYYEFGVIKKNTIQIKVEENDFPSQIIKSNELHRLWLVDAQERIFRYKDTKDMTHFYDAHIYIRNLIDEKSISYGASKMLATLYSIHYKHTLKDSDLCHAISNCLNAYEKWQDVLFLAEIGSLQTTKFISSGGICQETFENAQSYLLMYLREYPDAKFAWHCAGDLYSCYANTNLKCNNQYIAIANKQLYKYFNSLGKDGLAFDRSNYYYLLYIYNQRNDLKLWKFMSSHYKFHNIIFSDIKNVSLTAQYLKFATGDPIYFALMEQFFIDLDLDQEEFKKKFAI